MKTSIYKVCLLGCSFETGNFGVSALAASLVSIIYKIKPNAVFTLLIPNKEDTLRIVNVAGIPVKVISIAYRRSPLSRANKNIVVITILSYLARIPFLRTWAISHNPILTLIDLADFIGDIHGGDSFSDIYGLRRFKMGCIPLHWIRYLGKPLHMLPQTYGPFFSPGATKLARIVFRYARNLQARDRDSQAIALSLSEKTSVAVVPDVAFCLEPHPKADWQSEFSYINPEKPLIGLNVSGLLYRGGYTQDNMFGLTLNYATFSHRLAERLLLETNYNILLIPHTVSSSFTIEDDRSACNAVLDVVHRGNEGRILVLEKDYDQSELKSVIGSCSFFIGGRMHACIAALSQGIPTVGIAYSKKFKGVFDIAGKPDWVLPATEMEEPEAIDFVLRCIETSKHLHRELVLQMESLRSSIYEDFQALIGE